MSIRSFVLGNDIDVKISLTFKNTINQNTTVHFNQLDLRQDMLTIQAFNQMEMVWKSDNLEYGMIPYKCLSAGDKIGFIQVCDYSKT